MKLQTCEINLLFESGENKNNIHKLQHVNTLSFFFVRAKSVVSLFRCFRFTYTLHVLFRGKCFPVVSVFRCFRFTDTLHVLFRVKCFPVVSLF